MSAKYEIGESVKVFGTDSIQRNVKVVGIILSGDDLQDCKIYQDNLKKLSHRTHHIQISKSNRYLTTDIGNDETYRLVNEKYIYGRIK